MTAHGTRTGTRVFNGLRRYINFRTITRFFMYVFLLDLVFVFIYPFLYMLVTSLKSPADLNDISVEWILNSLHWDNYRLAFTALDYPKRLLNTVFMTVMSLAGHVMACAFVGYGFARFKFRGKNFFFIALILSIIVPTETIIVPLYLFFSKLGWAGTQLPIIAPTFLGFGLKGALFIFIFRQFFLSMPASLEEASLIDGCGPIKTYFKIAFPMAKSSIMVCVVLGMVWHWNDFFEPTIYLGNQDKFYLSVMLPSIYQLMESAGGTAGVSGVTENLYTDAVGMAATALIVLPIFLAYMVLQRQFMEGVERSGLTGE